MYHGALFVLLELTVIRYLVVGRPLNHEMEEEKPITGMKREENAAHIQWGSMKEGYGLEFSGLDKIHRLKRSPPMTTGEPWPMPQFYEKKSVLYTLLVEDFNIKITHQTCDVIEKAAERYNRTIFEDSMEKFKENIRFMMPSKVTEDLVKEDEEDYKNTRPVSTLYITILTPCTPYPTPTSDESYNLKVMLSGITISSKEVWGALRGLETLSQLVFVKNGQIYIKETEIKDFPRFQYRGILIDTARHFISKSVILDVIEGMSQNKLNALHWHIVDDQSFPYQSKVYPDLSEKGAYHPKMVYTHYDIAEIIEYARQRGIRVIPEFDVPGHTLSWGFAFPELLSDCYAPFKPKPVFKGPLDPSNAETFEFLYNLFKEVMSVFKDDYVHIGGDEVFVNCWESNPSIDKVFRVLLTRELEKRKAENDNEDIGNQNKKKAAIGKERKAEIASSGENNDAERRKKYISLGDEEPIPLPEGHGLTRNNVLKVTARLLWQYFMERLTDDIKMAAKERGSSLQFVVWEDAVAKYDAKIPNDTIVQVWSSNDAYRTVISKGYRTIYSHCWYLDKTDLGVDWPSYYRCDPSDLAFEKDAMVLGGEACLWSEYVTSEMYMTQLWPRASAVAERLWSNRKPREIFEVAQRLQEHRCRMLRRGLDVGQLNGPEFCLRGRYRYKSKDQVYMELGNYWTGPMNTTILIPDVRIDDKITAATGKKITNDMGILQKNASDDNTHWVAKSTCAVLVIPRLYRKVYCIEDLRPRNETLIFWIVVLVIIILMKRRTRRLCCMALKELVTL